MTFNEHSAYISLLALSQSPPMQMSRHKNLGLLNQSSGTHCNAISVQLSSPCIIIFF